ncbi:hypothetical protein M5362_02150 [Streptomyces sp. Je 1-79]|uniref:hypothetical protein n=1 Tax=Streptomyces sp. Je 1-79 TaxID=2943847 RepID=UPI0021A6A36F|nr:hypothetical protein [Streptomyces sp. Je 1-79]MCT4351937.1 hypothetical protein [Streptomyces sp. Je 1-79]
MARVTVDGTDLVVRLSLRERLAARRGDVRVPLTALREVRVEPDWWRALRGSRGRGLWIPGRICVGTRVLPDGRDFAAVKAGTRVLCVELRRDAAFGRLAVSDPDPERAVRELGPYVPTDLLE